MGNERPTAAELLREYSRHARLVIYLAAAPGAGKTRRLIAEARRLADAGVRVAIGRIETKGRPDLEASLAGLPVTAPRHIEVNGAVFEDFDLEAALRDRPDVVILDELAHTNVRGGLNEKRWQDAKALREAGIGVIGALNVAHVDSVAATAERAIGRPVREIVPLSFLKSADEVIALDVSTPLLRQRVRSGKIVALDDAGAALAGPFSETALHALRELLLRTVDAVATATLRPRRASLATAVVLPGAAPGPFVRRVEPVTTAMDLALHVAAVPGVDESAFEASVAAARAERMPSFLDPRSIDAVAFGTFVAIPAGDAGRRLFARTTAEQDVFIVAAEQVYLGGATIGSTLARTAADRMRRGYGKLTVYLGSAAGSGKTHAMLDRAHQMLADGTDVVAAYVETHGRTETAAQLVGIETLPRRPAGPGSGSYEEMDREGLIERKPQVALIDELAHTNARGSVVPKRYEDVLAVLRAGIDVITTLNVQHLEGVNDSVERLTGTHVRETLPDEVLSLADDIILIDVSPGTLRERLRDGKIYPLARVESALANFFRRDNLEALRELAIREALRSKTRRRTAAPFDRLLLGVTGVLGDERIARRANALAARMQIELAVVLIVDPRDAPDPAVAEALREGAARFGASFERISAPDVAAALLAKARTRAETTIVVPRHATLSRRFGKRSLADALLDAGARELLVFAGRASEEPKRPGRDSSASR